MKRNSAAAEKLREFVEEHRVKALNVAGPRASKEPGAGSKALKTNRSVLLLLDASSRYGV
jgi:hypothetical protein